MQVAERVEKVETASPEARFLEVLNTYRSGVYGYLARAGLDAATRDDVFQDVFLKVHKALPKYPTTDPIRPWLFTIVSNTVRDHFRKQKVRSIVAASTEAVERRGDDKSASSEAVAEAKKTVAWLEEALLKLPIEQREVVLMVSVEGMKLGEVAKVLDIPEGTVKTRLRRARIALTQGLQKRRNEVNR